MRQTSDVDLKARIFKARRLLQVLDDVSQLSRVALLAVHAPRRSRQAVLVALLKTLLPKIYKHGAAKRTTGNLVKMYLREKQRRDSCVIRENWLLSINIYMLFGFLTCWGTCWVARCSCPAARTAAAAARTVAAAARPARRTLGACFARRAARTWWAARLRTGRAAEERT